MIRLIILIFSLALSQNEQATKPEVGESQATAKESKKKTMKEALKNTRSIEGLIALHQDSTKGKLYMSITREQLEEEFIYFVHGYNGHMNVGVGKGWPYYSRIIKINRYYNRIEFEIQNNSFYFDKSSPLSKSSETNITTAILASSPIISEENGLILIEADKIFMTESLHQITRGFVPGGKNKNPFRLGRLTKDRTKYKAIKNYPENTDIIVQYVYTNPTPTNYGSDAGMTDARSVNATLQHSFIKVPKNDYVPRYEDPRVGYFTNKQTDMTVADDPTPYRDMIQRWYLQKKDPTQEKSEVKEPLVWWIENTTPYEFRDAIKEGVLAWNKAFEAAGFINALEVKVQPDTANWDAGDIRYNVLRWTSSPNPPFGGLGPRFTNPRTGQILGADIMLEYVYFTNRVKYEKIYDTFNGENENYPLTACHAGHIMQQGNIFGMMTVKETEQYSQLEQHRIIYESLVKLTLHEVGHCLGLSHNFFSSQLHSLKNIHDRHITEPIGLVSSVMDYVTANVGINSQNHGQFYTTVPGPYDIWAIEFGYTPSFLNQEDEKERVRTLLSKSTQKQYGYGNDSDDMRSPGRGIDPRIMISDMSDDAVGYAQQRMDIINSLHPTLLKKFQKKGESYHEFRNAFYILNREYANCVRVISRYIGGIYLDRSMHGQKNKKDPYIPVPEGEQKWAMTLLNSYLFSPDAFDTSEDLYRHLQPQRRGWSGTQDPKIHDMYLGMQKDILNHLLHPKVLKRISDAEFYGNKYSSSQMIGDLTVACFSADAGANVNSIRRNLQTEYTRRLINVVNGKGRSNYDHSSVSLAFENLEKIKKYASRYNGVNESTKAHRKHLIYIIDKALDT